MNTTVNVAMLLHLYAARVKDTTMLRHDQNSARKKSALSQKSNTIMMSTTSKNKRIVQKLLKNPFFLLVFGLSSLQDIHGDCFTTMRTYVRAARMTQKRDNLFVCLFVFNTQGCVR
jgi:hypothetical protein